jgi:ATP-dependent DNA helicase DinG
LTLSASLPVAQQFLTPEACHAVRIAISQAAGHEVFFMGSRSDGSELVDIIEVLARGNQSAAPALIHQARRADVAIHNHPSGNLTPSDQDLRVASLLAEAATGFYIVNNDVNRLNPVVPIPRESRTIPVSADDVEEVLGVAGSIARALPGYEHRSGQSKMARAVARSLTDERLLLCEAGTGVGKTFAYLVPAILWACRNRKTIVVSTGTINLQEQIHEKDIPFLQGGFLPKFRSVLIKGRSNYMSLRRAEEAALLPAEAFETEAERVSVSALVQWARRTRTGDRTELSPKPLPEAWERVESQSDNCLGARCPRFSECHYYRVRQRASKAEILIVNHHLLFADLAAKHDMGSLETAAVLPAFDRIVVDEAHKLEDIASQYFGTIISEHGLRRRLGKLLSRSRKGRGLIPALIKKLGAITTQSDHEDEALERAGRILEEELGPLTLDVGASFELAFDIGRSAQSSEGSEPNAPTIRLRSRALNEDDQALYDDLLKPLLEARDRLGLLTARGRIALENLDQLGDAARKPIDGLLLEYEASLNRLRAVIEAVDHVSRLDDESHVRWFELNRKGKQKLGTFKALPLKIAKLLRAALWTKLSAGVMTSATLTTSTGFAFLRDQLGLDDSVQNRVEELCVESPFDFSRQALLCVPKDHSEFREAAYIDDTCYAIDRLTELSAGRCFVLFTSYKTLKEVGRRLESHLKARGLVLLRQGQSSRRELLNRFRRLKGAVLFGTDSFWEGVDVPGSQLSLVIVAKLPFRVPSDPLQEARAEFLESEGRRPFNEMMLPQAILRLRQGFGRLIRTRQDRGVVVILDCRVLTRSYGHRVLSALPPAARCIGDFESRVLPTVKAFFEDGL